jgi:hypothetical protein
MIVHIVIVCAACACKRLHTSCRVVSADDSVSETELREAKRQAEQHAVERSGWKRVQMLAAGEPIATYSAFACDRCVAGYPGLFRDEADAAEPVDG